MRYCPLPGRYATTLILPSFAMMFMLTILNVLNFTLPVYLYIPSFKTSWLKAVLSFLAIFVFATSLLLESAFTASASFLTSLSAFTLSSVNMLKSLGTAAIALSRVYGYRSPSSSSCSSSGFSTTFPLSISLIASLTILSRFAMFLS